MKYGFVIILIKIVGYNDPGFGHIEKARKTDLLGLPLAVEIFLTGPLTAVSAAISILSS